MFFASCNFLFFALLAKATPPAPITTAGAAKTAKPATIPPPITAPAAANPLVIPAALKPTTEPPKYKPAKPIAPPTPAPTAPVRTSEIGESTIVLCGLLDALSTSFKTI